MNIENQITVNREYKSSVFALLFKDRKKLLSLYNALNHSNYTNEWELEVLMLNINEGNNEELKNNCQILKEYMLYINRIRSHIEKDKMSLQNAVEITVNECIQEGILEEFLRENHAEVVSMSILEFDAEREWRLIREAEYQYGLEAGMEQGLKALVDSLKTLLPDIDAVYNAVIKNEIYKDITKEQIEKIF